MRKRPRRADRRVPPNDLTVGPSTHTATYGDWWEANRASLVRERLRASRERHSVLLDIGCGSGYVISDDAGIGSDLKVGLDAWLGSEWKATPGSVFVVADVAALPFRDGVADVVLSLDVIEHLRDERIPLLEAARVLRPNGIAVVMVPAFPILWSNHDVIVGHYRRYRLGEVADLFASSGIGTLQRSYFYSWLFPVALTRRMLSLGRERDGTPRLLAPLGNAMGRLERFLIMRGVSIPIGSSAYVEGRRDPNTALPTRAL
jgi:SAM-dependent methyltransferase